MTVTPIASVLETESDHVACFDRRGREYRWPEFMSAIAGLRTRLADTDATNWALDTSDSFEFACALLACWSAGKTPVLAPEHMIDDPDASLDIDGIISSTERPHESRRVIAFDSIADADAAIAVIDPASDLILFTSGSTGQPTRVCRAVPQFDAELRVLDALFGQDMGPCAVYSTVSHRHVYGLLFRLLWPLLSKRPFATFDYEFPENLMNKTGKDAALIASPALLKRIGHLDSEGGRTWRAVYSSGGLLPDYAARDALRLLGCSPVEVLGSTETSGVAWRQQYEGGAATPWQTLPDVAIRLDREGFLEVKSAFSGHGGWLRMGDRARLLSSGSLELLGRGDHVAKIEDKRISLAEIEKYLMEHPWIVDAAAVGLDDGKRQYVGAVVKLSEEGQTAMSDNGRKDIGRALRNWLRGKIDPVAYPRKIRYENEIPVNAQGKRQEAIIRRLFEKQ